MSSLEEGMVQLIFDLIRINNDRAGCYKSVMIESNVLSIELIEILRNKLNESRKSAQDLTALIESGGIYFSGNTIVSGKIFRVWKDARKMFNSNDQKVLINDCDCVEEAVLEAYKTALTSNSLTDYACRKLIMDQKYAIQVSQEKIKKYRDLQELVLLTPYEPLLIGNKNLQKI